MTSARLRFTDHRRNQSVELRVERLDLRGTGALTSAGITMGKVEQEKRSHAIFWGMSQYPYPIWCVLVTPLTADSLHADVR